MGNCTLRLTKCRKDPHKIQALVKSNQESAPFSIFFRFLVHRRSVRKGELLKIHAVKRGKLSDIFEYSDGFLFKVFARCARE